VVSIYAKEEEFAITGLSIFEIRENTFHRTFEKGWVLCVGVKFVIWVVLAKHIQSSLYSARRPWQATDFSSDRSRQFKKMPPVLWSRIYLL